MFLFLFLLNLLFSFLLSSFVFLNSRNFYRPLTFTSNDGKKEDLHEKYDEFASRDKMEFWPMFFSGLIFAFPKLFLSIIVAIFCKAHIQLINFCLPDASKDKKKWEKVKSVISFYARVFLVVNGVRVFFRKDKKKKICEVYKKFLGEDYEFEEKRYSLLISNHTGFFEVVIQMMRFGAGFIAKKEVRDYLFVGPIAAGIQCFFIDRSDENERKKILERLESRQRSFFCSSSFAPLAVFPEGTTTSGRHILKFKRGAFSALLPLKPSIINIYQESDFHMAVGGKSVVTEYLRNLTHCSEAFYVIDMPVIKPTEFMFSHFSHLGNEKWEVFAEVTRKIFAEIGCLSESSRGFRDELRYAESVEKGKVDEEKEECRNSRNKKEKEE